MKISLILIFRSVAVARLIYAASAWNGFITETDRKRVDAFLKRSKKCGFCSPELQTFSDMVNEADQRLFFNIRYTTRTMFCMNSYRPYL